MNENNIKAWTETYYVDNLGTVVKINDINKSSTLKPKLSYKIKILIQRALYTITNHKK